MSNQETHAISRSSHTPSFGYAEEIKKNLNEMFTSVGFEIYPFKIGWYNDEVAPSFQFDLPPDTLAFLVISTPDMFECAFAPFMCREECTGSMDLLDKCMKHYFSRAKELFNDKDVETVHDFELLPSRRPKILVQVAGHVAGAAYYYTQRCLNPNPFEKKMYGVSIHPKYGGWFALRGAIIFKSVQVPELTKVEPLDVVPDQAKRAELLELFNDHWRDWRFRDIIAVEKKYSEQQIKYFETLPKDRKQLIAEIRQRLKKENIDLDKNSQTR